MSMKTEATKDERAEEQRRKAERAQRRNKYISDGLFARANDKPGFNRTLFYARQGQYGEDDQVLVWADRDHTRVMWYDPTENSMYGLAIFETKLALITAIINLNTPASYVAFKRTFLPRWETKEEEVAVVYDKGVQ